MPPEAPVGKRRVAKVLLTDAAVRKYKPSRRALQERQTQAPRDPRPFVTPREARDPTERRERLGDTVSRPNGTFAKLVLGPVDLSDNEAADAPGQRQILSSRSQPLL